tara:strand:- start:9706 stop:10392 length:687 start_codon:yes stop_codon:yes gene_type:complete
MLQVLTHINDSIPLLCLYNFLKLAVYDKSLCFLFGKNARWYQLHCFVNLIITKEILPTVVNIMYNPELGYKLIDPDLTNYLVVMMHLYHIFISNKLTMYDWLHHIIFVLFGVLPGMIYVNSNQLYLHKIACSGIPGIIEYGCLSLQKNNKLSKKNQKLLTSIMYICIRLPMCIMGITMNYLAYNKNLINDPLHITLYVNLLLYMNGVVFTYLTLDSYSKIKYLKINYV